MTTPRLTEHLHGLVQETLVEIREDLQERFDVRAEDVSFELRTVSNGDLRWSVTVENASFPNVRRRHSLVGWGAKLSEAIDDLSRNAALKVYRTTP